MGFWRNVGVNCKTGVECAANCELIVMFDYVIQLYHTPKTIKMWEKIYTSLDKTGKDISPTHKLAYDMPTKTHIIITKNKEIADQYREYTWKFFSKEKPN